MRGFFLLGRLIPCQVLVGGHILDNLRSQSSTSWPRLKAIQSRREIPLEAMIGAFQAALRSNEFEVKVKTESSPRRIAIRCPSHESPICWIPVSNGMPTVRYVLPFSLASIVSRPRHPIRMPLDALSCHSIAQSAVSTWVRRNLTARENDPLSGSADFGSEAGIRDVLQGISESDGRIARLGGGAALLSSVSTFTPGSSRTTNRGREASTIANGSSPEGRVSIWKKPFLSQTVRPPPPIAAKVLSWQPARIPVSRMVGRSVSETVSRRIAVSERMIEFLYANPPLRTTTVHPPSGSVDLAIPSPLVLRAKRGASEIEDAGRISTVASATGCPVEERARMVTALPASEPDPLVVCGSSHDAKMIAANTAAAGADGIFIG